MKVKSYLFSTLPIVFALVALPAVAADTAPGFKSADQVIAYIVRTSDIVLAELDTATEGTDASMAIQTDLTLRNETAQIGTGVFKTVGLVGCSHTEHSSLLFEVGWQITT